jgi:glycosyltransferase involved in cell wall biosynthesis
MVAKPLDRSSSPRTERRLRVLQIFNRYLEYGGEEGSVYRIGDALQAIHDVEYFITSSRELQGGIAKSIAAVAKVHRNTRIAERLRRFQAIGHFDVWLIHNVFPTISPVAYEIAFSAKIPVVQYLHNYRLSCVNGFFLNHGEPCTRCIDGNFFPALQTACWQDSHLKSGMMGNVLRRVRKLGVFDKVAHWIAISEAQKRLHVRMGVPDDKISVVPHFFHAPQLEANNSERNTILYIGRLSREKGVDVLLRAWKSINSGSVQLKVVGDGPDRFRLENVVREEGISNVEFAGFIPPGEQNSVWNHAIVSVVPSIWEEPFGMVVLEAWNRGVGVVVSAVGGLDEIVTHAEDGLKFPTGDAEALTRALREVIANPQLGQQFARFGREKLIAFYNKDRWLEQMREVFEKALKV